VSQRARALSLYNSKPYALACPEDDFKLVHAKKDKTFTLYRSGVQESVTLFSPPKVGVKTMCW
jgi:hypothetical protein